MHGTRIDRAAYLFVGRASRAPKDVVRGHTTYEEGPGRTGPPLGSEEILGHLLAGLGGVVIL